MRTFSYKLDSIVQLYLPPEKSVNRDFLRLVLKGEKALLPISDCKFVNIPHYDELGVRHIFENFSDDSEVMKYLMDEYPKGRYPDRQYFYTILNTVHPDYVKAMVEHANKARFAANGQLQE